MASLEWEHTLKRSNTMRDEEKGERLVPHYTVSDDLMPLE